MFKNFDDNFWNVTVKAVAVGLLAFGVGYLFLSDAKAADNESKLFKEAVTYSAQLNDNCSSTLIYSDRDKVSGEVKSILLTAKHCVAEADGYKMKVEFPVHQGHRAVGEKVYYGEVKGKDYKSDLALIQLTDKNTYFPSVAKVAPDNYSASLGDQAYIVGYPMGLHISVTPGNWGGLQNPTGNDELLHINANVVGGNSGGAAFKEIDGEYKVIGVTCCGFSRAPWVGYYTSVEDINRYLKVALPELYKTDTAPVTVVKTPQ